MWGLEWGGLGIGITLEQGLRIIAAAFAVTGVAVFLPLLVDAYAAERAVLSLGIANGRMILASATVRGRCMSLLWSLTALVPLLPSLFYSRQEFPPWLFPVIGLAACVMQFLNVVSGIMNHRDMKRLLSQAEAEAEAEAAEHK